MRHTRSRLAAATAAAVLLSLTAIAATAAPDLAAGSGPTLQKYQIVTRHDSLPGHTTGAAGVSCPTGTTAVGGGVSGSTVDESIGATSPSEDYWRVVYNNIGSATADFVQYAVCVKSVPDSYLAYGPAYPLSPNDAATATATVTCPPGTVALGGGSDPESPGPSLNLNSVNPTATGTGWAAKIHNRAAGSTAAAQAGTLCAMKPAGYAVVTGTATSVAAGSQSFASVACPTGTHVLAGGAHSDSSSAAVNLNASYPNGTTGWRAYENNISSSADTLTAYAVCAKTKT